MTQRIGLYGGSFNPIHFGHLIVARAAAEAIGLDRILLIPSGRPPHKDPEALADGLHRTAMLRLAVEDDAQFEINLHDLEQDGPCYTVDTVAHFAKRFGSSTELCWLIGADSLAELATWKDVATLVDRCRIVTAARPGWETPSLDALRTQLSEAHVERLLSDVLETPRIDISASMVRDRVRCGLSIRYFVPEAVDQYIVDSGIYRT